MEKIRFYTVIVGVGLMACSCAPKIIQAATSSKDSVSVQISERIIRDTILVPIPVEEVKVITRDTASRLETSVAISNAKVVGGDLIHELYNKPQELRAPVVMTIRDTVTLRIKEKAETIVKEVPAQLSRWQSFCIVLGQILGGIVLLFLLIKGLKKWVF